MHIVDSGKNHAYFREYTSGAVRMVIVSKPDRELLMEGDVVLGERDASGGSRTPVERTDAMREADRKVKRKRRLNEKILAIGADKIVTLTHRANIVDFDESRAILRRWLAQWRARFGLSAKYVAVPERQKRGAIHWHVAVAQRIERADLVALRSAWHSAHSPSPGEPSPGSLQVAYPRDASDPFKVAGYVGKYLGKSQIELDRARASYVCSTGIRDLIRRETVELPAVGCPVAAASADLADRGVDRHGDPFRVDAAVSVTVVHGVRPEHRGRWTATGASHD